MGTLSGRSAIITGGLTGQGLAIAHALAREGANVAVGSYVNEMAGRRGDAAAYPDPVEIAEVRSALEVHGGKVFAAHLDVRDTVVIDDFVGAADKYCGPADILVNAAGTTAEHPVSGHSDELWLKIIDTNLNGAFRVTRRLLPGMIERGFGRIINIGSTAASVGWKENPAYCASKSGLLGLTRCVALEGAPHGVTCVMISPTWVETELMRRNVEQIVAREGKGRTLEDAMADIATQNPQLRIIQPEEVAALAAFLCREEAKGITMENIQITGGSLW
ncbi:NAD(P)-dependent dehydrogenase (short-subunit alcohol dehydrogenase family) [Pseudaminobacter salicylatoxidans]|uniref:NAD(P)-dependent dehydrogenase (Short-subunit alcohol dehydrogenase family) n=1 Tax=Pseudaminobacter salicylatoxidans TaxID=93369 RepID=A0A316C9E0_PSESE|nr:SDR family NAD(P)-dependent oxidoreductase [Pseudaminobacter salicylatoxidans]PWJ84647.1 NAD(P)-dependent dehydrogenase (short-subunit alcohol dehydrogenase family) [Pseudaminobacter salicylatoxidans]